LDRDDLAGRREALVVRPFGLEGPLDDAVEPDLLAIGEDDARDLVLRRHGDVHGQDGEGEAADLLQRDGVFAAGVAARLQLAAEDAREQRALLGLRGLTVSSRREPLARPRRARTRR